MALSGAEVAQLVKQAGFPTSAQAIMVAIAKAESGWNPAAVGGRNTNGTIDYGLFQINSRHGYDRTRLTGDAKFNTTCAKTIYDKQGFRAWSTYNAGRHTKYLNEARQAVAQASSVSGNNAAVAGTTSGSATGTTTKPAVTYGAPGPEITVAGVGTPLAAQRVIPGPLEGLRIIGSDIQGDFSAVIIGEPTYSAGWGEVPNLNFVVADPQGDLLWRKRNVWVRGARVIWKDLDMRIDEITFEPGSHTTGQLSISCIDSIVYALQNLKGTRVASNISATQWIAQELQLAGINPSRWFLGESVPTQSEISRDIPDDNTQTNSGDAPSAWTTAVRLAKELGRRVFVSGNKLIFGSSVFALRWAAPGNLLIAWHAIDEAQRWQNLPSGKQTSIGTRQGLTEVTGRIPLDRAQYFRPGASVLVRNSPSIAGDVPRQFVVSHISHTLARDIDGADVTLSEPVDPVPQPASGNQTNTGSTSAGTSVSGGGADGQIDQFVALCLRQVGDKYVFGAEVKLTDPDPHVFDCSELIEWAASRVGIKGVPDGSINQINKCKAISVAQAKRTKGALLYHPGHIAVSLGNGRTVEAQNPRVGVVQDNAGNRFTRGGLIPGAKGYR